MTSIATKLENDPELRDRAVTVVCWMLATCGVASVVGIAGLIHLLF
jgi:L-cystine uptake protein TcyP (sodium:dicarboxylate symporter family)